MPKKPVMMLFAPTISAITSTRKISVRKNPLRSPPKISTPPATTMPMIERAKATGPVTDVRREVSQLSYGSEPPVLEAAMALSGATITASSRKLKAR
ncbi:hypothetical protein D3C76_878210 [compost metagenome]